MHHKTNKDCVQFIHRGNAEISACSPCRDFFYKGHESVEWTMKQHT